MDPNLRQPYNIFPAIRRLRDEAATIAPDERHRLMATIALNAADRRAVALAVDMTGDDFARIYPPEPEPAKVTTDDAIDTFLDRFGNSSPEENALLERLIFNPVPDYSTVLAEEAGQPGEAPEALPDEQAADNNLDALAAIASAINTRADEPAKPVAEPPALEPRRPEPAPSPRPVENRPKPRVQRPSEQGLSLELAKIFIKQRQFDRAHEIISKISLNNPEKSVYFANQLRFLEKLIRIQRLQDAARDEKR